MNRQDCSLYICLFNHMTMRSTMTCRTCHEPGFRGFLNTSILAALEILPRGHNHLALGNVYFLRSALIRLFLDVVKPEILKSTIKGAYSIQSKVLTPTNSMSLFNGETQIRFETPRELLQLIQSVTLTN